VRCCDDGNPSVVLHHLPFCVSLCVCAVEYGVAHDVQHAWFFHLGLCEHEDVQFLLLHGCDDGVNFSCLHKPCGVPASNADFLFGWYLHVMPVSVRGGGLQYVCFEPLCSGVLLAVCVMLLDPLFSALLWCGDVVGVACVCVWVMLEPAVVGCVVILIVPAGDFEMCCQEVVVSSVGELVVWCMLCVAAVMVSFLLCVRFVCSFVFMLCCCLPVYACGLAIAIKIIFGRNT
jgi:hypothetical protein